jgi:hypothetical protein
MSVKSLKETIDFTQQYLPDQKPWKEDFLGFGVLIRK